MPARVGFIGVGLMGHGMATCLIAKGHALTVMGHRNRVPVDDLVGRGATEVKSAAQVAKNSNIVFLCVTGSTQVEALVRGPDGIAAGAHDGLTVIDCSTSDPNSTVALAAELKALGVSYADAPLGGTPAQAAEGKLSAMVGCDADVWPRIEPAIGAWAAKAARVGATGDGHKLKLLMNFLSMGYGALYAELLVVARKNGVTPQAVDAVMRGSRFDCGMYQTFFAWVLNGEEQHKFTIANSHKDMRYLAAMAESQGVANPMGAAVKNYYALADAAGHGGDFVPALSDFVAALNGVELAARDKKQAAE
jgi:3-hydroxyisobutyrate dehydrogenase-like beta-hydroxyacid dehydrogenase